LSFSPDGTTLALGTFVPYSSAGEVKLIQVADGSEGSVLTGHENAVTAVAYAPDGKLLASGSADRSVRLWDPVQEQPLAILRGHGSPVQCIAFTPDGRTLASAGTDGVVRLWDVAAGRERADFDWGIGYVNAVAFAPDGMTAAAGGADGTVFLWDVDDFSG
jgi:WD40 repeat protein